MATLALAIKYRPKKFNDVIEQDEIKQILTEQLDSNTIKNGYLFTGPAGTGKTTNARIFGNECNKFKGSIIEVDAASNNGVDDVRVIIDNAKRKSLDSEYKVYVIDECHMFSTGAWNAMLKLLEEPPKSTIFILCTTDPQKIPGTILSRVQRYDFTKISLSGIVGRLKYIIDTEAQEMCEAKGNEFLLGDPVPPEATEDALEYIAKLADGGMRDAITMLDKCISFSSEVTLENVVKALGAVDYEIHFELLYNLTTRRPETAVKIVETVYNSGKDIKQFLKQFQYFVLDICKYKLFQSFQYVQIPNLPEYVDKMNDEDYADCLEVLDWCKEVNAVIKWESNAKAVIESEVILHCRS